LLELLEREHRVRWSAKVLRRVTAAVSRGVAEHLHQAQKQQLLDWLRAADGSKGRRKITLAAGRDGGHRSILSDFLDPAADCPIRHPRCFHNSDDPPIPIDSASVAAQRRRPRSSRSSTRALYFRRIPFTIVASGMPTASPN